MKAVIALIACAALAGCGAKDRIVTTPTPVACVKRDAIPPEPPQIASQLTGDARQDVAIIAVSALELRDWGQKLRALLRGCE